MPNRQWGFRWMVLVVIHGYPVICGLQTMDFSNITHDLGKRRRFVVNGKCTRERIFRQQKTREAAQTARARRSSSSGSTWEEITTSLILQNVHKFVLCTTQTLLLCKIMQGVSNTLTKRGLWIGLDYRWARTPLAKIRICRPGSPPTNTDLAKSKLKISRGNEKDKDKASRQRGEVTWNCWL